MPSYPLSMATVDNKQSGETWPDKRLISIARDGTPKERLLATAKGRSFRLTHIGLTAADKSSFETFYDANRGGTITLTWFGTAFTVMFADENAIEWKPMDASLWQLTLNFLKA